MFLLKKKDLIIISNLFDFKIITDKQKNEYVIFRENIINDIDNISDKTQFEALENHIHLCDDVKRKDLKELSLIGQNIGQALFYTLKSTFPQKDFIVYVSITVGDSMIIRFHQKWQNEYLFYEGSESSLPDEIILKYEDA